MASGRSGNGFSSSWLPQKATHMRVRTGRDVSSEEKEGKRVGARRAQVDSKIDMFPRRGPAENPQHQPLARTKVITRTAPGPSLRASSAI